MGLYVHDHNPHPAPPDYLDLGPAEGWDDGWREYADPATTCLHELQGGRVCRLDKGHRGRHSSVVFNCDGCGKTRRGHPYRSDHEQGVGFCFMCIEVDKWRF